MASPLRIVVPLPLALRSANAWLFPGAQPALVDTGIGTAEGYATLHDGLRAAGLDGAPLRLHITHGHMDHAGNAARLQRHLGSELHAPRAEAPFVETFRRDASHRYEVYRAALRMHGVPEAETERMQRIGEGMDPWTEDARIAHDLHDGAQVALGDTSATAHILPGHTPGSTVFATQDNDLLTGDTLLEHITSNAIELADRDAGRYAQYLRSLDRLRRFVGMRALPGHHDPFDLTDALLDAHLQKHAERSRRILDRLDQPRTAWELVPKVFPRLATDQAFLGVCEVVGHLHALEAAGRVRRAEADGVRRFHR